MSRRLVLLNVLLVVVSAAAIVYIVQQIVSRTSAPPRRPRVAAATVPAAAPPVVEPPAPPGSYASVAARNLFSPSRSEAPAAPPTGVAAAPAAPKPNLYGVVLREGAPIAYLEDPATKRVIAYRTGDSVAGGTVKTIAADYVVLTRPEGSVEVRLNDPSKPRPPAPVATPVPGQPPVAGAVPPVAPQQLPGVPRLPEGSPPGQVVTPPVQPPAVTQPPFTGRRPLPPNLRRMTPGTVPDAAQQ